MLQGLTFTAAVFSPIHAWLNFAKEMLAITGVGVGDHRMMGADGSIIIPPAEEKRCVITADEIDCTIDVSLLPEVELTRVESAGDRFDFRVSDARPSFDLVFVRGIADFEFFVEDACAEPYQFFGVASVLIGAKEPIRAVCGVRVFSDLASRVTVTSVADGTGVARVDFRMKGLVATDRNVDVLVATDVGVIPARIRAPAHDRAKMEAEARTLCIELGGLPAAKEKPFVRRPIPLEVLGAVNSRLRSQSVESSKYTRFRQDPTTASVPAGPQLARFLLRRP
jgi:hypothetical protein